MGEASKGERGMHRKCTQFIIDWPGLRLLVVLAFPSSFAFDSFVYAFH